MRENTGIRPISSLLCTLALIGLLFFVGQRWWDSDIGRASPQQSRAGSQAKVRTGLPVGNPADYFPTDIGHTWEYHITVEDEGRNALFTRATIWTLIGGKQVITTERGRHLTAVANRKADRGVFTLTLRIKGKALKQGHLQYSEGYQVQVVRDDLNIYDSPQDLFYAISRSQRFMLEQVRVVSPHSSSAPSGGSGPWGGPSVIEPGYDHKLIFFGQPHLSIDLGARGDALVWMKTTKDSRGRPAIIFERRVEAKNKIPTPKQDPLDKSFVEERTFVRGVGMTRLVQKVYGKTTMTWILQE